RFSTTARTTIAKAARQLPSSLGDTRIGRPIPRRPWSHVLSANGWDALAKGRSALRRSLYAAFAVVQREAAVLIRETLVEEKAGAGDEVRVRERLPEEVRLLEPGYRESRAWAEQAYAEEGREVGE